MEAPGAVISRAREKPDKISIAPEPHPANSFDAPLMDFVGYQSTSLLNFFSSKGKFKARTPPFAASINSIISSSARVNI
jgi:hypothetical protein